MTKQERYDELERKLYIYNEALDHAQGLYDALEDSEIAGIKGLIDKSDSIVAKLEEKIEKTEEYIANIDI